MHVNDRKAHWENIYTSKSLNEVSWYQPIPHTSLKFIDGLNLDKSASIIDVGGGDGFLVDHLLDRGFENLTVLDISEAALAKAKHRLGMRSKNVTWINADASTFTPDQHYDVWHDRAAFHFLTQEDEVAHYVTTAHTYLNPNGTLVLGTFSETGPTKCSGIEIQQYSEPSMTELLAARFEKIHCFRTQHLTPFNTQQDFLFCAFRKNS